LGVAHASGASEAMMATPNSATTTTVLIELVLAKRCITSYPFSMSFATVVFGAGTLHPGVHEIHSHDDAFIIPQAGDYDTEAPRGRAKSNGVSTTIGAF
jgi:hypothetical protein